MSRGSSGGSGVAVGANLATIGICEQSGASCQGPASRNGIALILTTKGIMPDSGGIGNQWFNDRAGIHARTLADAARVLDAVKDPATGYYDPRDPFTAMPKALVPEQPYASFAVDDDALERTRSRCRACASRILREHMVKTTPNHEAISDQIDREIKTVLRDQLGAELVETMHAGVSRTIPPCRTSKYTFADALSEILPRLMPEIFSRRDENGELFFAVPGYDVTSYDYLLKLSSRQAPLTTAVNITTSPTSRAVPCHIEPLQRHRVRHRPLSRRPRRRARSRTGRTGSRTRSSARTRRAPARRTGCNFKDHTAAARPIASRAATSRAWRCCKVMYENDIDVFVHPENTVPTPKIQGPNVGTISLDGITPFFQIPRIVVPAGVTDVIYEPQYALNEDKTDYDLGAAPRARRRRSCRIRCRSRSRSSPARARSRR